jgi:hypothetical protein
MKNETVAVLSDRELETTLGGINASDAITVGGIALGVAFCVLLTPVGAGVLLCCASGVVGLAGDAFVAYGVSHSQ